jgi:trigger factor
MDVQVEKTGAYLVKVTVTLPQSTVDEAFAAALRGVAKQAQLPGFRTGKVPRSLLERHFGAQMHRDVQTKLVENTLFAALDQHSVAAVAMPKVTLGSLTRGAQFRYTAEAEVRPEITLGDYKGLAVTPAETDVQDSEIEAQLTEMRTQAAQMVPVTDRTVAREGDFVLLDYTGSIDGVPFAGGTAQNTLVELGGADYIPGFAEGIVGSEVPGQRDVEVSFPADYNAEQLAGRTAIFAMTFKELKARELPELDEAFAQDMGAQSLVALRQRVRDDIAKRKDEAAETARRREVLKALVAANPFEVPPSMVDSQVEELVASARARVERMTGRKFDLDSQAVAELRGSSRDDAEFMVRSGLLMLEVSRAENITVSDADVDTEVARLVEEAGEQAEMARRYYQDPARRESLNFRLLEDRTVAFLLEHATPAAAA